MALQRQCDALDSARRIGDGVAHERNETGMAGRAERAAWMKAQDLIDRGRECGKIDLADFGQIARSGSAQNRYRLLPQPQRAGAVLLFIVLRSVRREPREHSVINIQIIIDPAMSVAAKTMIVPVGVELAARRLVGVERAADLAVVTVAAARRFFKTGPMFDKIGPVIITAILITLSALLKNFGSGAVFVLDCCTGIGSAARGASILQNRSPLRTLAAIGRPSAHAGGVVMICWNSSTLPTPAGASTTISSWTCRTMG